MAEKLPKPFQKMAEDYYVSLFDHLPTLPMERLKLGIAVAPEFTKRLEEFRAAAVLDGALDDKTKQLISVAFLAARASAGTYFHAKAARKFGASWGELHKAVELAAFYTGFSALNEGGQALVRLYKEEQEAKTKKANGKNGKARASARAGAR
jgi:alkylhydroperoxidase/carboxymuconolactone decarboxylase family protein YurZ